MMPARTCKTCNRELSFFEALLGKEICGNCVRKRKERMLEVEKEVVSGKAVDNLSDDHIAVLASLDKKEAVRFFRRVARGFTERGVIDSTGIVALYLLQQCFELSDSEVRYDETVLPKVIRGLEGEIAERKNIAGLHPHNVIVLSKMGKQDALDLYFSLYRRFEADSEISSDELRVLAVLQGTFKLSNNEVKYNETLLPYVYVDSIRRTGMLPIARIEANYPIILKKGEVVYCGVKAVLKELKTIQLGYEGGSRGVSIRIMKGVYYRIGAHRGHMRSETQLVETSRGFLIVTNKRLFLQPDAGNPPLSIPLEKVLSYGCYQNGIEVYKDGRQKGYFFAIDSASSIEIFGICLGHLLAS